MDLYDVAVARKLSSGGGGGSSDFSTAEVTFSIAKNTVDGMAIPMLLDFGVFESLTVQIIDYNSRVSETLTLPLYKGHLVLGGISSGNVLTTGSVEYMSDTTSITFIITGDCTITIS